MDLDVDVMPHNTPEARAALVNAPRWTEGLHFGTYPRNVPDMDNVPDAAGVSDNERSSGWSSRDDSVILYGGVGVGKTGLGVCLLRDRARAGVGSTFQWNMVTGPGLRAGVEAGDIKREPSPCWFESWPRLLALHRRDRWDEEGWFEQLEGVASLMLDDVGVDAGTPYRESFLLRHLEWSVDRPGRSLVLTINDPVTAWRAVLGERAVDRVMDFAYVHVAGESLRGRR